MPIVLLSGCAEVAQTSAGRFGGDKSVFARPVSQSGQPSRANALAVNDGALQTGNNQLINERDAARANDARQMLRFVNAGQVELSLKDASIQAAAKAVLGDALKVDYVVAAGVDGTITIQTTGPIPKSALLSLFEAALEANGAQIERVSGGGVKIVQSTSGNRRFRTASQGVGPGAPIIVAPLQYVSAVEMAELLQPLVDDGLTVIPESNRNLLLMVGAQPLLEAGLDALNLFDVDVLRGKSVALVRLRSADPEAIVEELKTIFETEEGGMLSGVVEFIPNQRLGSVLIISTRSQYIGRAREWIKELDRTALGSAYYLQTYELQNRTAVEVAPIINTLIAGSTTEASATETVTETATQDEATATVSATGQVTTGPRVVADNGRNALIVRARRSEHEEVRSLLRTLDNPARQVLLEATIAEVALNDEINVGVRWFFEQGDFSISFSDLASGAVASSFPGFSAIINSGGASVALNALSNVTDVNVISSPTLMVVDNKEGVLQIGDQVPVATQTTSELVENSLVSTQVEYRDTGIILRVQPRIGKGGRVTLDITQEVSDVSATQTSGIDSPTISQRMVQTSVVLYDGQTLVLGGLVQESDNKSSTKTPFIGDVPVVGALFRDRESRKRRTELLILIRPRVIYDHNAARSITEQWRHKLRDANSILETGLGSPKHTIKEVLD